MFPNNCLGRGIYEDAWCKHLLGSCKEGLDGYNYGLDESEIQSMYLQPIITQYFIDNKSEIWSLSLIVHSKNSFHIRLLLIVLFRNLFQIVQKFPT